MRVRKLIYGYRFLSGPMVRLDHLKSASRSACFGLFSSTSTTHELRKDLVLFVLRNYSALPVQRRGLPARPFPKISRDILPVSFCEWCTVARTYATEQKAKGGEKKEMLKHADSEDESPDTAGKAAAKEEVQREVDDQALPHFRRAQEFAIIQGSEDEPFPDPSKIIPKTAPEIGEESLPHPIWTSDELRAVRIAHKDPKGFVDWAAYVSVQISRRGFDLLSGYTFGTLNEANWLRRLCYLENIAGVPGMMGAMVRHLKSLRTMKRDNGWIHTLLEEAENERMHLMVVLEMKQPGPVFRFGVAASQGVYVNVFFLLYLISPRFCHRFVGYLEEEAVTTYTRLIDDIENGLIPEWKDKPATGIAKRYWKLPEDATLVDMFLAIRADEAHHRLVNHTLSSMQHNQHNPFKAGH